MAGEGAGKKLWGYYPTTNTWVPLKVNATGKVIVDMSAVNLNDLGDTNVPAPSDNHFLYWHDAAGKWQSRVLAAGDIPNLAATKITTGILAPARVGPKIQDADADTYLWVEKTADEDKIHGVVKSVEAFLIDDIGALTLAKQPAARAYFTGNKYQILDRTRVKVRLNTESYDLQGEFDSTDKTGTATATTANHLIDTTLNQFVAADVGRTVWNYTDNTYAVVTAYNSTSDLTLDTNIMASGEGYRVYMGRYTAKVAGLYVITGMIRYYPGEDKMHAQCSIQKNGTDRTTLSFYQSGSNGVTVPISATLFLSVNDYLELVTWNDSSAASQQFDNASGSCWMAIAKIA